MKTENDNLNENTMRIGVDIGGTEIKFGVVSGKEIIEKKQVPTLYKDDTVKLVDYIACECREIIQKYNISQIGIGVPGSVRNGVICAPVNLPFRQTPLGKILTKELGINVSVENDANCAALGEMAVNRKNNIKNLVMLTIGTGIGSGIIINNEIYCGNGDGGELGHMIIKKGGRMCKCGQRGCVEQYVSTTALISNAIKAAKKNKDSLLYSLYKENAYSLNGKLFFKALSEKCYVAKKVFHEYTDYFAETIKSINYILNPDVIVLSGGITKTGKTLLEPIIEKVGKNINVEISTLQNDAGILGATLVENRP